MKIVYINYVRNEYMEEMHRTVNRMEPGVQEDVRMRQDAQSIGLLFKSKENTADDGMRYHFIYRETMVDFTVTPDTEIGMFRSIKDMSIGGESVDFSFDAGDPDSIGYREECRTGIDDALSFLSSALSKNPK